LRKAAQEGPVKGILTRIANRLIFRNVELKSQLYMRKSKIQILALQVSVIHSFIIWSDHANSNLRSITCD